MHAGPVIFKQGFWHKGSDFAKSRSNAPPPPYRGGPERFFMTESWALSRQCEVSTMRILRMKQVEVKTGSCGTHIRRMEKAGRFPARVKISERAYGYVEEEVDSWIQERMDARKHQAA